MNICVTNQTKKNMGIRANKTPLKEKQRKEKGVSKRDQIK
jgi:hypothetical protein